jgi:fused signal recognition particle receptor
MAFDWFRRQYSGTDKDKATEQAPAEESQESTQDAAGQADTPGDAAEGAAAGGDSPEIAPNQLAWAQAAYQNIKKRQQEAAAAEATPSEAAAEAAAEAAPSEPVVSEPVASEPVASEPTTAERSTAGEDVSIAATEVEATDPPEAAVEESGVEESGLEESGVEESGLEESGVEAAVSIESRVEDGGSVETDVEAVAAVAQAVDLGASEGIVAEPDALEPGALEPDVLEPDALEPDALEPDALEPDALEPDALEPDVTSAAAPVPFWAQQTEADRLERLERLRETAIVEPDPITPPPATTATSPPAVAPTETEDLLLDEGFLWSAEILASQGRRPDQVSMEEITWLNRLRQGLDKTRRGLINQLRAIVGQGPLNEDAILEIETALLQADVGVAATDAIIDALQTKLRSEVLPPDAALQYLRQIMRELLDKPLKGERNLAFVPKDDVLNIWLITGVNGAGKTTTIGKLAHIAQKSGYTCMIAAADTFRAAAVEQVKVWGARSGVEVIANPGQNTDPAAVVFDAIAAAQARGANLLLVDTAGRLQNKKNLMDELSKVRRIIDKKASNAAVESLLVLDSTLGQNGLRQAEVFSEAAQLSGVVLTKLDGTAKGGIALAVAQQLDLPIRFIGAGEGIEDLRPFSSYEFVEALLNG